ncbi:hypothetical protein KY284_023208 [Solanum tuberosum]|nr:hypothetical protein KY284_023208 [Solanum tuberosum]
MIRIQRGMNGLSQKWTRFVNNKRKKASQVPLKIKKKQSRWCSYVNVNVFVDITKLLEKIGSVHLFKESPFGYLLGLSQLKVQPQIIRCLVHHLSNNRDDMFGLLLLTLFSSVGLFKVIMCGRPMAKMKV